MMVALYLSFKWELVVAFGAVQQIGASIQFKGLANGTDHDLNGASTHPLTLTAGARADLFGKGGRSLMHSLVGMELSLGSTSWKGWRNWHQWLQ